MGNKILELIPEIETWNTQDIETLISILQDYIDNERKDH